MMPKFVLDYLAKLNNEEQDEKADVYTIDKQGQRKGTGKNSTIKKPDVNKIMKRNMSRHNYKSNKIVPI